MSHIISESEKNLIRKMHNNQKSYDSLIKESSGLLSTISESVVITDWLSPDDKYVILFDELYDLTEGKKLGDIWENFDNFKLFISHSFNVATNVPQEIKESVIKSVNSLILTESISDLRKIKPLLKQFLKEEGFLDWVGSGIKKTGEWAVDSAKKFGGDIADLAKTGWNGLKKAGVAISQGDWAGILDLFQKGMLYVARKVRSLMYNPVGMVLDAILIATGIGKAAQWIPWAIIVALDLYEIISGDYEEKDMATWLRWLMVGTDVLGLIFAGGVAGSAKAALSVFRGAKTEAEFAQIAAKNPNTIKWIEKIIGAFAKVPEYLGKAATYLKSTKLAKATPWIENILTKSEGVLARATESLSKISNTAKTASAGGKEIRAAASATKTPLSQTVKAGTKAGLKTAGVVTALDTGFKKGAQLYAGKSDQDIEDEETIASTVDDYEKEYGKGAFAKKFQVQS